ncbi:MAG: UDP-3-O-(3-hydroxymyristoyl)glucosamine N-acyltransferase [Myxococcota bacterium]
MPRVPLRLDELAGRLGRKVEGGGFLVRGVAGLDQAGPGDLSFVRSPQYDRRLASSRAGAVIAPAGVRVGARAVIRSDDPGLDFSRAVRWIVPEARPEAVVHPTAVIAADASVDALASVGPHCSVGAGARVGPRSVLHAGVCVYPGAVIGADCRLHARVVVGECAVIGDRVVLYPGVVLGAVAVADVAEAVGLAKVPQVGRVVLEDDVEIGAGTTVDRGTLGDTRIGRGSVIDNLVQIGHNCRIGERVIIVAQVGLGGSTIVEDGAVLLGQTGVTGHLSIGAGAVVGPQAGVHRNVPAGARVLGSPQREERSFRRAMAALGRLPGLFGRVRALERRLAAGSRSEEEPPA